MTDTALRLVAGASSAVELSERLAIVRGMLADSPSPQDASQFRRDAEALRVFAQQRGLSLAVQNYAVAIKLWAERRLGELLPDLAPHGGARKGDQGTTPSTLIRLKDLGLDRNHSARFRALARVPEHVFAAEVAVRETRELTSADLYELARQYRQPATRQTRQADGDAAEPSPLPGTVRLEVADALRLPLDAGAVDLIVTSPPYGLDKPYGDAVDPALGWQVFMQTWLLEAYRVARDGGRLALNVPLDTTLGGYRPTGAEAILAAVGAGWTYRSSIVWLEDHISHRVGRGSVDSASAPHIIAPVELVALFSKGDWRREPPGPSDLAHEEWLEWTNGLWRFSGESRPWEGHPAPFPLALPWRLIKLLSFPGDVVCDPFVGSGTTALAALRLGRQVVGFDRNPGYIAAALRRVAGRGMDRPADGEEPGDA